MRKLRADWSLPSVKILVLFICLGPAGLYAQTKSLPSRPFTSYERFLLESEMVNQLQNKLDKYIDPAAYQLKLSIEGRMLAGGDGPSNTPNKPEVNPQEEIISMLPALPFFDSKRRIEAQAENEMRADTKPSADQTLQQVGPEITRMRITLVTDTSIKESEADFYGLLVKELIGFNPKRGDQFTWNQVVFPPFKSKARQGDLAANKAQFEFAGDDPLRINLEGDAMVAQIQRMADALKYEAIILLAIFAAALIAVVVFFNRRQKTESTVTGRGNRQDSLPDKNPNPNNKERLVVQELNLEGRKTDVDIKKEDKLLKWLLHHQRHLVLLVEKFTTEQGPIFLHKLAVLLQQYRSEYATLLCSALSDVHRFELESALQKPLPSPAPIAEGLALIDLLDEAFQDYSRHGFFPFVLFMSNEELADLLQFERAMSCLMVFDGLPVDRQRQIMKLLEPKKVAEIISQIDELPAIRYNQYELLSATLFERLSQKRTAKRFSEQNLADIIQTIKAQPLDRQAIVLNDLRLKNRKMHQAVRNRLLLWSDLDGFTAEELRSGLEIFNGSQLVELLKGDESAQKLLLPLRPAREQLMLKETLESNVEPSEETDDLRKQLLEVLYGFRSTTSISDKSQARRGTKN